MQDIQFCLYLHSQQRRGGLAYKVERKRVEKYDTLTICESSSVGRARPCQGRGREFESRLSLKSLPTKRRDLLLEGLDTCSDGGTGRHAGLKILFP